MKVKNRNFSILSQNCVSGVIYHDTGYRFLSPTVNLFMASSDFPYFVMHIKEYVGADIVRIDDGTVNYPVGILSREGLKGIRLDFVHYHSFEDAVDKWKERYLRINYDNILVVAELGCESSQTLIEELNRLPYRKLLIVNTEYKDMENCAALDIYDDSFFWGKILTYRKGPKFFMYRYLDDVKYIDFINNLQ